MALRYADSHTCTRTLSYACIYAHIHDFTLRPNHMSAISHTKFATYAHTYSCTFQNNELLLAEGQLRYNSANGCCHYLRRDAVRC